MRKLLLGMCLATVAAFVPRLSASAAQANQERTPSSIFEVASVKVNKSGDTNGLLRRQPGGRVNATNMPLRQLIQFAYSIAPYQLIGGPGWMAAERSLPVGTHKARLAALILTFFIFTDLDASPTEVDNWIETNQVPVQLPVIHRFSTR